MESLPLLISENDVNKQPPVTLASPTNPTPTQTLFLSNIDQTVAFPVETLFFFDSPTSEDIVETVKRSVSEVLLVPYYFMAGRLNFNFQTRRLELVCNNAGVLFVGASSKLTIKDLGDVSSPNPSFQHLISRTYGFRSLAETPIWTIQVTKFKCGGYSIGFVMNHCTLDGRSAAEMFQCLASICRGEELKAEVLFNDRMILAARSPPCIEYAHTEYTKLTDTTTTTFTSPHQASLSPPPKIMDTQSYKLFHFSSDMISSLKSKAMTKCSSFEAIVAHIWRARTRAVFEDPSEVSTVMFAVDITSKMNNPPLPIGFIGNAVITASASAQVVELVEQPLCCFVGKVRSAIERVTDDYVRSVIDWLEVHKGVPSTMNGNFFVSAWYKLPFHELDFGSGRPVFGGPVVSGLHEFVLLLSEGSNRKSCKNEEGDGLKKGGGINVWMVLEQHKMERFMKYVFEM